MDRQRERAGEPNLLECRLGPQRRPVERLVSVRDQRLGSGPQLVLAPQQQRHVTGRNAVRLLPLGGHEHHAPVQRPSQHLGAVRRPGPQAAPGLRGLVRVSLQARLRQGAGGHRRLHLGEQRLRGRQGSRRRHLHLLGRRERQDLGPSRGDASVSHYLQGAQHPRAHRAGRAEHRLPCRVQAERHLEQAEGRLRQRDQGHGHW